MYLVLDFDAIGSDKHYLTWAARTLRWHCLLAGLVTPKEGCLQGMNRAYLQQPRICPVGAFLEGLLRGDNVGVGSGLCSDWNCRDPDVTPRKP